MLGDQNYPHNVQNRQLFLSYLSIRHKMQLSLKNKVVIVTGSDH